MTTATYVPSKFDYVVIRDDAFVDAKWKGIVYEVVKVNPKNVVVQRADGVGQGRVNVPAAFLTPAPVDLVTAVTSQATKLEPLHTGSLVRVSAPGWRQPADQLWVVIKVRATGFDIAKLGGSDQARYYRDLPRATLTAVSDFQVITA